MAPATLARSADGGGVVAVVLIVTTSGGPGWLAGLFGASITAPHLAGPFLARRLDTPATAGPSSRPPASSTALVLAAATFAAAALVRLLPAAPPAANEAEVPRPLRTLQLMLRTNALRRILYLTMTVALSVAVLSIVAVASTATLAEAAGAAGALTADYGIGNLAGSAGVTIRPPRGNADTAMTARALIVAGTLTAVLLAPEILAKDLLARHASRKRAPLTCECGSCRLSRAGASSPLPCGR